MRKLVYAEKDEYPDITSSIHGNDFPSGWSKIPADEFVKSSFFHYYPSLVEYRQMIDRSLNKTVIARLFHFNDGTGVAMEGDHQGGEVHYYKFGCCHNYIELPHSEAKKRGYQHWGGCWHIYECNLCNHIMSTDSSD